MGRILRSLIYSAAVLLLLAVPGQGAGAQKQPFALTLQAPKQPLKAGKPVVLRLIITNTSDHKLYLPISQGSGEVGVIYRVHVLDERGHPAPPHVPPPPPKGKPPTVAYNVHGTELQPGQRFTDQVDVTALYDLSQPGKYKIWIVAPYYRGPHVPNGLVRSNTVTETVVR
jgi:hypothetical protein